MIHKCIIHRIINKSIGESPPFGMALFLLENGKGELVIKMGSNLGIGFGR